VEAPTAGSMAWAGVPEKVGAYGMKRVSIPGRTEGIRRYQYRIACQSVVGKMHGAMVAIVQKDIKKLRAYPSISHMGMVMRGISAGRN
jgi:NADH:ubiquinone oxidoreductase subunit 4 (chain M)